MSLSKGLDVALALVTFVLLPLLIGLNLVMNWRRYGDPFGSRAHPHLYLFIKGASYSYVGVALIVALLGLLRLAR